jgi:diaminobutyrate-2-oxoglutarate transaminase
MPSAAAAASGVRGGPASWESSARTSSRNLPLALVGGDGAVLTAADGRRYLDCLAGARTLTLGHNHPIVVAAIRQVLDSGLPLRGLDFPTPVRDDFVEAALKLVRIATGRRAILAFRGGYHGMTAGALAATGNVAVKTRAGGPAGGVHFLPYPYAYRCPFRLGGELGWQVGASYVERLLDDPESGVPPVAGMLLEVVQGEGGSIPAPVGWLRAMRRITPDRGIPLIVDEVQTGLGRTGRLFAVEHAGTVPDVLVLSKAVGGGLPLAVLVYAAALDRWPPGAHTGTFRGNHGAVVRFLPPLILTAAQVDQIAERFADAVAVAESEHAAGGPP